MAEGTLGWLHLVSFGLFNIYMYFKGNFSNITFFGPHSGFEPTRNLGVQLTLLQPGGQIMPTALLLAHPDLKT